jgi:hypothetical protein
VRFGENGGVSGNDESNRANFDRWQEHVDDRHLYFEHLEPPGRAWKTLLAMLVALGCFVLFFCFLVWLVAGAPLP